MKNDVRIKFDFVCANGISLKDIKVKNVQNTGACAEYGKARLVLLTHSRKSLC
jgi:hypothetical protein